MLTLDEIHEALRHLTLDQRSTVENWLDELDRVSIQSQVREARPLYFKADARFMTLEEFLEFEERSPLRHEFVNGAIFAMNGATVAHQRIVRNLSTAIDTRLKPGRCEVFSSGLKVVIQRKSKEISYYPDLIVDCRPDTRDTRYLRDPKLIVEVLSPSTQLIDRREKLQNYRRIDSVEEYVIVAQDIRRVTVYPRVERWMPRVYWGIDAAVELRSIDVTIPFAELYRGAEDAWQSRSARSEQ
jgi:Uma2 family endonuclease